MPGLASRVHGVRIQERLCKQSLKATSPAFPDVPVPGLGRQESAENREGGEVTG